MCGLPVATRSKSVLKMEVTFPNIIVNLGEQLDDGEMQMVVVVARLLWLRRNKVVYGGDLTSPTHIMETALSQLENYSKAEQGKPMTNTKPPMTDSEKWCKPQVGFIKLNWDAVIDIQRQQMGVGIIARDHTSAILAALSASRPHVTNPGRDLAIVAWKLAEVCTSMGLSKVVLEGDSLDRGSHCFEKRWSLLEQIWDYGQ